MATKTQPSISSDVCDIDKCNDEVDPRVQVTFQIQIIPSCGTEFTRCVTN